MQSLWPCARLSQRVDRRASLCVEQGFRPHLEVYAQDEERLKHDFGQAFKKLTELGCGFS